MFSKLISNCFMFSEWTTDPLNRYSNKAWEILLQVISIRVGDCATSRCLLIFKSSTIALLCYKGDMTLPAAVFPKRALRYTINEVVYCIQKKKRRHWLRAARIQEITVQRAQTSEHSMSLLSPLSFVPLKFVI